MRLAAALGHNKNPRKYLPDDFWANPTCSIGLEWEFEQSAHLVHELKDASANGRNHYLVMKQDGSLRDNGIEVTTTGDGLFGIDLLDAIRFLEASIRKYEPKYRPVCNYRTAFHVHLDIRDLEVQEVHNLLLIYCLLEKPIFNFVGKDRDSSNFCIPWFRSDSYFGTFKSFCNGEVSSGVVSSIQRMQRYSALNCQSIHRFGTLEFRHMENDLSEISSKQISFINITMRLKQMAVDAFSEGFHGERFFHRLKEMTPKDLISELKFDLPIAGWDYPESLMLASGMVMFKTPQSAFFNDAITLKFVGSHPNWK